jgi:hypothetical protein
MASASPLERACIGGIARIGFAIKGVGAKIPRSPRLRAKRDEILAQARISPTRGGASRSVPGNFDPTPIVQRENTPYRLASQHWEDRGQNEPAANRLSPPASPGELLSPAKRAKHPDASSACGRRPHGADPFSFCGKSMPSNDFRRSGKQASNRQVRGISFLCHVLDR